MKLLFALAMAALFLMISPALNAHDLVGVNGQNKSHQHVYRKQDYGKVPQQGHLVSPPGGRPMVLWGSTTHSNYGKVNPNTPRLDFSQRQPLQTPRHMKDVFQDESGQGASQYGKVKKQD